MSDATGHPAILTRDELLAWRDRLRRQGKRLVQCHGCFDIVHPGHVRHLRWAKAQGDALLVTITADSGIRKGPGRPLIPHDLRAENLACLDMVDAVHVVHAPTAEQILRAVQPDVYVKGQEYEHNQDPRFAAERAAVEAAGGKVVFSSGDVVFSSSALIAAMEGGLDTGVDPASGALASLLRQPEASQEAVSAIVQSARGRPVLVVGEWVQEVDHDCQGPQVAPRESAITVRPAGCRRFDGGAAGVALHLAAMGMEPILLTCPPDEPPLPDAAADRDGAIGPMERLARGGVKVHALRPAQQPMQVERFCVGAQALLTVDRARPLACDQGLRTALLEAVESLSASVCAVCIADQGLGLIGPQVATGIARVIGDRSVALTAGCWGRGANPLALRGADLLCLHESVLRRAVGEATGGLSAAAWSAMQAAQAQGLLVGLGREGVVAFERLPEAMDTGTGWPTQVRARPVPSLAPWPLDVRGADEAMLAGATLALAGAGGQTPSLAAAALLAAVAEACVLGRPGPGPVTAGQLLTRLGQLHQGHLVCRAQRAAGRSWPAMPGRADVHERVSRAAS
ncbi:MAG: bifunctional protein HldE [Phycisphaerales bacterium]|nr:MAG: bifunctional protein HldE [Phycisphaerales bacterium]